MRFNRTNIKNLITVCAAALAVSAVSVRADFNPPGQVPPAGNVDAPVYKVGTGQTLTGSLTVTASSGAALAGSSVGYGLQGIVTTDAAGGDAALYGYAFGADATDYAAVFYGGLGVQLASGDIYYLNRNSGMSWPRVLDEAALYGLSVTTTGELRLLGHGAGINFLNQSVSSLLTVSEAGVVNVAAGGALRVNNVDVCLSNGTNCPAIAPGADGWTDAGTVVRLTAASDNVGIGTASPGSYKLAVTGSMQLQGTTLDATQTAGTHWFLNSYRGVQIRVDSDNNSVDTFTINNGANATVFTVDEGGIVTATGGFSGPGGSLTSLTASNLSSGTVPLGRLSGITTAEIATNILSSVDGVTNDGGNIDLVAGSGITLTPDDAANTITIAAAGGGADIATASCDSGNVSPPSNPVCSATCPAGYEVVSADVLCSLGGDYVGEGGNPGTWGCTKIVWDSASTKVTFRGTNTGSSGDKRVYGMVWCIKN